MVTDAALEVRVFDLSTDRTPDFRPPLALAVVFAVCSVIAADCAACRRMRAWMVCQASSLITPRAAAAEIDDKKLLNTSGVSPTAVEA